MPSIVELAAFNGSEEEYRNLLENEVSGGFISQETADALLNAFLEVNGSPEASMSNYLQEVEEKKREPTFLEKVQQEELAAMNTAAQGEAMPPNDVLINRASIGRDYPISGLRDEELGELAVQGDQEAFNEMLSRKQLAEQSFIESLSNPQLYSRTLASAGKGVAQLGMLPEGMLALGTSGIEALTGFDIGGQAIAKSYDEKQQALERALGVGPALTPTESIAESLTGALVPGGILAKTAGIGADFFVDQTIRELTDTPGEKYETVFDRIGITNNNQRATMSNMAAIGIALLGGALSAKAIDNLVKVHIPRTRARKLIELDPDAPKDLWTVERAGDLTKANIVDEQQALKDILRRQGIPAIEDIEARIELDTHAASRTRVEEAINTGKLKTADASFDAPVAPRALYNAYNSLDGTTKENVARYINLKDMRDDVVLAIGKGKATNADLMNIDVQLQNIVKSYPVAEQFSKRYNAVTASLREYAQGSLFSPQYKLRLDRTRANYVPLELSTVDPNAPFLQRIAQAQTKGGQRDAEWFLQNRNSAGAYNVNRRVDPFDMLIESVEATLTARMKNDTKVAIVDGLLNNGIGKKTIKRATAEEAANNPDRLVRIWRNGEKETYITSKLTAQLMQFDPYIAKYPALFIPKRLFEQSAVGPLSITFAPVTAIRDTIGGRVTLPQEIRAPSYLGVAKAVPQQLWAKALNGISSHFEQSFVKGNNALPTWLMSPTQQRRFADNVAQAYTQTLYHQANLAGGFDASLMKSRIEIGHGALEEVGRTLRAATKNTTIPGAKFSARRIGNMIEGFKHLFNAIQDAPRFAAIDANVGKGLNLDETVKYARRLTGDVTKSGRVYTAAGKRMEVDAVNQGVLNVANKGIGFGTEVLRESTPFLNPMIQGNRQLLNAAIADPIGFNIKAWKNIGLPTMAIYGWNEMLGKEYNDYAMNERSARDVVMNLYVGIPGRPPEEGIEIPMMHELLFFSAPFTRALYGLSRGEDSERTSAALAVVSENILSNSLDVGYPVAGQVVANISGYNAPDSLLRPTEGVYKIREDNIGVLPENIEFLARTLFASIGDTAINTANAVAGDPTFETFNKALYENTMDSMPIVKNITGRKKSNTYFSIPNALAEKRFEVVRNFRDYYNAYYEPKRFNEDGLQKPQSKKDYTRFSKTDNPLETEDLPFLMIGPEKLQEPTNPIYKEFGELLVNDLFRGEEGMTALLDRERIYSRYISRLKDFNKGDAKALQEWQALLNGIEKPSEDTQALKELVEDRGLDLSQYEDRIKLINEIEHRRADIINSQLDVFDRVEDKLTQMLREQGILGPKDKFDITKHLDPHDPNPFD